jgi:hypothetical protein
MAVENGILRAMCTAQGSYGGVQMKSSRLFLVGALVAMALAMFGGAAKADGLPPGDPLFKAGGDAPIPGEVAAPLIISNFILSCDSGTCPGSGDVPTGNDPCGISQMGLENTSPSCFFVNDIEINGHPEAINFFAFEIGGIPPGAEGVNCALLNEELLTGCSVVSDGAGGSLVTFTGSIPFGTAFLIDLEGFTGGVTSAGYANVPEPGTLPMLGLGLVGLLALTRKRIFQQAQ